ncbi:hypothetical protein A4A49_18824 [Nicotiana attenuata]|uniref:S-protein homolog n=1 Tax=Nicotiana attenuata TaxID=49451 RepID=A0A314KS64_NICAT|nr:hypothetical protein A4A49_18824 [Nicotiana attenuata]
MSSSLHHLIIYLFLLNFLAISSVNSQNLTSDFVVIIKNETPNTAEARCYIYGEDRGDYSMKPGWTDKFYIPIVPGGNNTLSCAIKLGNKHGFFDLFNFNDTEICHTNEVCNWRVHEEGMCMLLAGKCELFVWDDDSIRHVASEPTRYIASEPVKYVASEPVKYVASEPVRYIANP